MPDGAPVPSAVAVRTALCTQSSSLHSAAMRLTTAGAELVPDGKDGWRGTAERAQSALVAHIESVVRASATTLDAARQLTDAAIWAMSDVG